MRRHQANELQATHYVTPHPVRTAVLMVVVEAVLEILHANLGTRLRGRRSGLLRKCGKVLWLQTADCIYLEATKIQQKSFEKLSSGK